MCKRILYSTKFPHLWIFAISLIRIIHFLSVAIREDSHAWILSDIISIPDCRRTVWKMIDLFMVKSSTQECFVPRSRARCVTGFPPILYCHNPRYYPTDAGNGKGKRKGEERERESREIESSLLASTGTTWPIRSTGGVIHVDRSVNRIISDSLSTSLFRFLFKNFRIPGWNLLWKCIR